MTDEEVEDTVGTVPTRNRLLDSACELFARHGYDGTTVKDISDHADANLASVNYHFNSKEQLYVEAWKSAFQDSLEKHPPLNGVPEDAPARDRLKGMITSLIRRVTDPDTKDFLFAQKEMASPTSLLQEVMKECIHPLRERMLSIVREILGHDASDQTVEFCERSVVAQCLHLMMLRRVTAGPDSGPEEVLPQIDEVDVYAEHVYRFSMAGLRRARKNASKETEDAS